VKMDFTTDVTTNGRKGGGERQMHSQVQARKSMVT